jgi:hypothetical protein
MVGKRFDDYSEIFALLSFWKRVCYDGISARTFKGLKANCFTIGKFIVFQWISLDLEWRQESF